MWGYVCEDFNWTENDASVVCRELGFPPHGKQIRPIAVPQHLSQILSCLSGALSLYSILGAVPTFPFLMSAIDCRGSEEHLIDCPHSEVGHIASCHLHNVVSQVYCAGKCEANISVSFDMFLFLNEDPCNSTGAVRLAYLTNETSVGRVEVCYDGYWGSVCDDYANNVTADVVCRQLGYEEGQIYY